MPVRQIVCMKWGDKFHASDVNRLYRMVIANLGGDVAMACMTDCADGIDPGVRCLPLPHVPVVGTRLDRGWRKLGLFGPELADAMPGEVLYLDLDIAVTDALDPFFEQAGDFFIIRDYKPFRYRHRFCGNSSVMRFRTGAHAALVDELATRGEAVREAFRDEQEFVSDFMRRQGVLRYWPRGWCVSYKHDCVSVLPRGWWRAPSLPAGAKVVVFHGNPKPDEAIAGVGAKWYRPLKPAPWLRAYIGD